MELSQLAHRAARKEPAPSSPWAPLFGCVAVAAGAFAVALGGGVTGSALLVAPVSFALLGGLVAVQRWSDGADLRDAADAWIARGYDGRASRYAWRAEQLTSARERKLLARSVRDAAQLVRRPTFQTIVPLNRAALRPHLALLTALADRLADLERPVSAAGILAVHRLLTKPDSCLYAAKTRGAEAELSEVLDRLEVRR
jgi:hypothetical protein